MLTMLGIEVAAYVVVLVAARTAGGRGARRALAALTAIGLPAFALLAAPGQAPGARLLTICLGLYVAVSALALLGRPRAEIAAVPRGRYALYAAVWPGIDPRPLAADAPAEGYDEAWRWMRRGAIRAVAGIVALVVLAALSPRLGSGVVGWGAIAALLLALHLGLADMLAGILRLFGVGADRLFDAPLSSRSLTEFWGRRWNRPFIEMDRLLLWAPLRRRFGPAGAVMGVFLLSGMLHELAISVPAGGGYGLALAYFALHGVLVLGERRMSIQAWPAAAARIWTWGWILVPLALLFHGPFRAELAEPLVASLHSALTALSPAEWFGLALPLAAIGHVVVLLASVQVPARLRWREELPRLGSLNRKLMWTYGAFTVLTIVAFGALTIGLHDELLRGDRAALAIAAFVGVFWASRVGVDAAWFDHRDWPQGPALAVGHMLLVGLFCGLAAVYLGLVAWHALG